MTACMTMPGKLASNMADTAPTNRPSSSAYSGAVTGAQVFLNTVTRATMKPPMPPTSSQGMTAPGFSGVYRLHV